MSTELNGVAEERLRKIKIKKEISSSEQISTSDPLPIPDPMPSEIVNPYDEQEIISLTPYEYQVAGHDAILRPRKGHICKPTQKQELWFYESIRSDGFESMMWNGIARRAQSTESLAALAVSSGVNLTPSVMQKIESISPRSSTNQDQIVNETKQMLNAIEGLRKITPKYFGCFEFTKEKLQRCMISRSPDRSLRNDKSERSNSPSSKGETSANNKKSKHELNPWGVQMHQARILELNMFLDSSFRSA
eukprot:TRINITY_DN691_c0_g1_i3.p1 TRINITY_DN691_c0_g1~~TRINITY_DN691_c0_g1_i3.p1  ORF type:complete len:248 (-),score=55.71 TRINITY_DN691_c0_g1_i3:732-1475(-)